ncbi:FecR family protein [Pedobacter sp.]
MSSTPEVLELIARYLDDPNNALYKSQVDNYRSQSSKNEALFKEMERIWLLSGKAATLSSVDQHDAIAKFQLRIAHNNRQIVSKKRGFIRWAAAAVVFLAVATSIYLFTNKGILTNVGKREYASDVLPGGNKAILVLANGKRISLTDVNNGDVVEEAGLSITKTSDGQLVYTVKNSSSGSSQDQAFNTIETPKGGMWQVKLPDGSAVWLNAASSLTYPLAFSNGKNRTVELRGEAYFEVAKDSSHPFVVKTGKQEVTVLGTHFNINSYSDETTVKTTLLEGSVLVSPNQHVGESLVLKPGEQAVLTTTGIVVREVDADEAIDWKNGYFMFNNEKQESIMRKIARWYNVKVTYADAEARAVTYYGSISRFENVSKVLRKFEQTGEVRFEINNDQITVYKEDKN